MSIGPGALQQAIRQRLAEAPGNKMPMALLRREVGASDRSNFRRSVAGLERRGLVEIRLEAGEDDVEHRVVRDLKWARVRRQLNEAIASGEIEWPDREPEPMPWVGSGEEEDEEGEDPDPEAELQEARKRVRELLNRRPVEPEREDDYEWMRDLDPSVLEELRGWSSGVPRGQ